MAKDVQPLDEVLGAVGPRRRALRTEPELTLTELSPTTSVSVMTLSRLESGQRRPTLELLLPLARAYQVAVGELVETPPPGDPRVHQRPFDRAGITMVPLTRQGGGLQAYKQVFPARWPAEQPEPKDRKSVV